MRSVTIAWLRVTSIVDLWDSECMEFFAFVMAVMNKDLLDKDAGI